MKKMLAFVAVAAFAMTARAEYTDDCITFSSAESFTLKTANTSKNWNGTLWTSTDKTNWTEWSGSAVTAAQADGSAGPYKLYVRGDANNTRIVGFNESEFMDLPWRWMLVGTSGIACSGNIETLRGAVGDLPSPTPMGDYCYFGVFAHNTLLIDVPTLPATNLANNCYQYLFWGCSSLTAAPALPAETLTECCYLGMFMECTSLTNAPALPVTTLADTCYHSMFYGCTSLTASPVLPATKLAARCYSGMFAGCTSLTAAPELPATMLSSECYYVMFSGCASLAKAPELPATNLANMCYWHMFRNCTSLPVPPKLPAKTLASRCYENMFEKCTALKTAPELPATMLSEYCYCHMFQDCASLTNAPALPATTLDVLCYGSMFSGCISLTAAPVLLATNLATSCYENMFENCTALKTTPVLPATTLSLWCYSRMFSGCSSLVVNTEAPGKEWRILATTGVSDWGTDMFKGTSGTMNATPALNTTYYIASVLPKGSEDNPWQIGAGAGDTVNAWTNGMETLVVEGAGKMKAFASDGSDVPWPTGDVASVDISGEVTSIGQNAWHGLGNGVTYNGLSATAAKTMGDGFGGTAEYGRVAFKEFQFDGGSVQATVALETAKSLTNEWTEVELTDDDVRVENGRIVITHETDPQTQGFYLMQPVK